MATDRQLKVSLPALHHLRSGSAQVLCALEAKLFFPGQSLAPWLRDCGSMAWWLHDSGFITWWLCDFVASWFWGPPLCPRLSALKRAPGTPPICSQPLISSGSLPWPLPCSHSIAW